ncbi:MAG TPA: hypothetical protein VFW03_17325 [Gemmatimonadaceae bacterium]|nr:hypothetical protein [Gemmatimonadaceae bacterium]
MTKSSFHPKEAAGRPPNRRIHRATIGLGLTALFAAGAAVHRQDEADRERLAPASTPTIAGRPGVTADTTQRTWLEMKNVNLRVAKDAVVGVRTLRGQVMPTQPGGSALLDSTSSFSIRITSGTVALESADLGVILNRFVFGYKGSPLKHLKVRTEGDQLVQSGVMHKGVDLKFEIKAALSLTDSGWIRLHPTKVRVLGINGKSLLHALGLRLDDMLDLSKSTAARVKGDDIYLDPTKILPPPAITGRLTSVRVEGNALVQQFATLPDDSVFTGYARADSAAPNYLFFRGARLRFGRLEMHDTELQILDLDPSDPFDLFLAEYNKQLTAGYSRNRPNLSLQAFFPDYNDLGKPVALPLANRD